MMKKLIWIIILIVIIVGGFYWLWTMKSSKQRPTDSMERTTYTANDMMNQDRDSGSAWNDDNTHDADTAPSYG
jgi:uncharacterized protein YxeA